MNFIKMFQTLQIFINLFNFPLQTELDPSNIFRLRLELSQLMNECQMISIGHS